MSQHTFRQAVADYLAGNPGQWIDGLVLQQIGGCYAWRTRLSECRTQLNMCIENRQRKAGDRTVSEYRYVPPVTLTQARLWEGAA